MSFFNTILEIVFPSICISCSKKGSDLCLECLSNAPIAERESEAWIFPVYDYRHPPIKKALWMLKYSGKKRLANVFAEILYEKIIEELSELSVMENFRDVLLIPIPLSSVRLRERGYNQAELLCKELVHLAKTRNLTPPSGEIFTLEKNVLIKNRETEHQARIRDRSLRLKNLVGSFSVKNSENISGKNIILIDDITTTGATLKEAKKILKKSGAKKVIAFTIAH